MADSHMQPKASAPSAPRAPAPPRKDDDNRCSGEAGAATASSPGCVRKTSGVLPGSAKKGSEQPPSKMTRRDRAQKDVLPSESGGSQLSGYGRAVYDSWRGDSPCCSSSEASSVATEAISQKYTDQLRLVERQMQERFEAKPHVPPQPSPQDESPSPQVLKCAIFYAFH